MDQIKNIEKQKYEYVKSKKISNNEFNQLVKLDKSTDKHLILSLCKFQANGIHEPLTVVAKYIDEYLKFERFSNSLYQAASPSIMFSNLKYLFIAQIEKDDNYSPKFQSDLKNNIYRLDSFDNFISFVKGDAYSLSSDDIKEYFKMILNDQYERYIKSKDSELNDEQKNKLEKLIYTAVEKVNSNTHLFWPDLKEFITSAHNINSLIFHELFSSLYLWASILQEYDWIPPTYQKGIYSFIAYIKYHIKRIEDFDTFREFKEYMDTIPSILKEQNESTVNDSADDSNEDSTDDYDLLPIADNLYIYLPKKILVGINANWPTTIYTNNKNDTKSETLFPNQRKADTLINRDDVKRKYTTQQHNEFVNQLGKTKQINVKKIANSETSILINDIINDAKYGIWNDGVWNDGNWHDGTWVNGVWINGTWDNGVWESGEWKNGLWKDGKWEKGIWYNGKWKTGVWLNGEWYNGIWEDGEWKNGTWQGKNSVWKNGFFNEGTFNDGIFEDGIFGKKAIFNGGIFKGSAFNGLFFGGTWKTSFLNWYGEKWSRGKIFDDEYQHEFDSLYDPKEYHHLRLQIDNQLVDSSKSMRAIYKRGKDSKQKMIELISKVVMSDNPQRTIITTLKIL